MTSRIGILGGGQLARMLVQAAIPLGIPVTVQAARADDPAALVAASVVAGDWDDQAVLDHFATRVDVAILENEFVGARKLAYLENHMVRLVPTAHTLAIIEDKLQQKQVLAQAGLSVAPYAPITTPADLRELGEGWGWPLMLKTRRDGYDGKGTMRVDAATECEAACRALGWPESPLYAEAWVPFRTELATQVIRSVTGEECVYPIVETIQPTGVCRVVRAPAPFAAALIAEATRVARAAAQAVDALGILAVEMFVDDDGRVLVNELAPRPHNSGHYSIEGCYTSQFENALRAAIGLPLGDPALRHPTAVMVNVLAPCAGELNANVVAAALTVPRTHTHWYDKRIARLGRKLGHVTAVGDDPVEVEARAQHAVDVLETALCHGGQP